MKWTAVFPIPKGFSAQGERIMEQNIADWIAEMVERTAEARYQRRVDGVLKMANENHDTELDDFRSQLLEADTVIAMQETTLAQRFELLQTAEETINTLKETIDTLRVEVEAYEMDAEDDDGGDA